MCGNTSQKFSVFFIMEQTWCYLLLQLEESKHTQVEASTKEPNVENAHEEEL